MNITYTDILLYLTKVQGSLKNAEGKKNPMGLTLNVYFPSSYITMLLTSTEKYFSIKFNEALYTDSFSWFCRASILSKPPHSSIIILSFSVSPSFSAA